MKKKTKEWLKGTEVHKELYDVRFSLSYIYMREIISRNPSYIFTLRYESIYAGVICPLSTLSSVTEPLNAKYIASNDYSIVIGITVDFFLHMYMNIFMHSLLLHGRQFHLYHSIPKSIFPSFTGGWRRLRGLHLQPCRPQVPGEGWQTSTNVEWLRCEKKQTISGRHNVFSFLVI